MNTICLVGRLARDPELRCSGGGVEFCSFTVAVDRDYRSGEDRQADFIPCTAWRKTAVFVCQYFSKGDGVSLTGALESRRYTGKDGVERTAWGVTVGNVGFPPGKANRTPATAADTAAPLIYDDGNSVEQLPF